MTAIGAHTPPTSIRDPDWPLFQEFQNAAGGRIRLITLAPERSGSLEFIRRATELGIVVALGHTAADGPTIQAAVAAGARLSTHLGNGIAQALARHPNPIWEQAALDSLSASFIADGHHLDLATLRVLARSKGPERTILVSDASPLAGLPPGVHGEWAVDPSGKIVVAGTPYLAGSNQGLEVGLRHLMRATGWTLEQCFATVTANPRTCSVSTRPGWPRENPPTWSFASSAETMAFASLIAASKGFGPAFEDRLKITAKGPDGRPSDRSHTSRARPGRGADRY